MTVEIHPMWGPQWHVFGIVDVENWFSFCIILYYYLPDHTVACIYSHPSCWSVHVLTPRHVEACIWHTSARSHHCNPIITIFIVILVYFRGISSKSMAIYEVDFVVGRFDVDCRSDVVCPWFHALHPSCRWRSGEIYSSSLFSYLLAIFLFRCRSQGMSSTPALWARCTASQLHPTNIPVVL